MSLDQRRRSGAGNLTRRLEVLKAFAWDSPLTADLETESLFTELARGERGAWDVGDDVFQVE